MAVQSDSTIAVTSTSAFVSSVGYYPGMNGRERERERGMREVEERREGVGVREDRAKGGEEE